MIEIKLYKNPEHKEGDNNPLWMCWIEKDKKSFILSADTEIDAVTAALKMYELSTPVLAET